MPPKPMHHARAKLILEGRLRNVSAEERTEAERIIKELKAGARPLEPPKPTGEKKIIPVYDSKRDRPRPEAPKEKSPLELVRNPQPVIKKYHALPGVNSFIRLSENLCLARMKIPVTVLPPKGSSETAREVTMDLVVEFDPDELPTDKSYFKALHAQTVDGKHQVTIVGYGIRSLLLNIKRILKREIPKEKYFPAILNPWKRFGE